MMTRFVLFLTLFVAVPAARASLITSVAAPVNDPVALAAPAVDETALLSNADPQRLDLGGVATAPMAAAVTPVAATPEPASFALLGTGMGFLFLQGLRARLRTRRGGRRLFSTRAAARQIGLSAIA